MLRSVQGQLEKELNELEKKADCLKAILADLGSALIAYSGGVDSTFLAAVAHSVLGDRVVAVTAVSSAVPRAEADDAIALAQRLGVRHLTIETGEMHSPEYVANGPDRCYHCKLDLFGRLASLAAELKLAWVLDGNNADDAADYRPGSRAAVEHGVRSPLREAGWTKNDIRTLSHQMGLPTWDKPSMACLASRLPYGTPITVEALRRVEAAEEYVRSLGVRQLRVRHHGDLARIEADAAGTELLCREDVRARVVEHLKRLGYLYVTIDLAGYRSGSLNEVLPRVSPISAAETSS